MKSINTNLPMNTSKGRMNYIGMTVMYFDETTRHVSEETKKTYCLDYLNTIFPLIELNMPVEEIDEYYLEQLLLKIKTINGFSDQTIKSRFRHLLYAPWKKYMAEKYAWNIDWGFLGSTDRIWKTSNQELSLIPRSFSFELEMKIYTYLLSSPLEISGANCGLLLMALLGLRNNEACGLNYSDLIEFENYPGNYYILIYKTTSINSSILKSGGKTTNAIRKIPVMNALRNFLLARKKYLNELLDFPVIDENGITIDSVDNLPIACKNDNITRLSTNALSIKGKQLLKQFNIDENVILQAQLETNEEDVLEKEVSSYIFRRNWATTLYKLGVDINDIALVIGHSIDEIPLNRRDELNDEKLNEILALMNMHPINSLGIMTTIDLDCYYRKDNVIELKLKTKLHKGKLVLDVHSLELNDVVHIDFNHKVDVKGFNYTTFESKKKTINVAKHLMKKREG